MTKKIETGEPEIQKTGEQRKIETGTANLIPMSMRTKEEVREIASRGGKKSGETRRKNKTLKEAMNWIMDQTLNPECPSEEELLRQYPGLTNRDYIAISALRAATQDRDVRAMVFARDTSGEVPKQTVGIEQEKPFEITIKTIE